MPHGGKVKLVAALCAALLLGACASTEKEKPVFPDPADLNSARPGECNQALAALIGGAIGAMVIEENRARGAALGAGLGTLACAIINAASKQTRPGIEVDREYRAAHQGRLPERPTVSVYDTSYNAAGGVSGGQQARVVSNITVIQGEREPVREMREVLEVFEPGPPERVMLKAEKSVENASRAGGFQNVFDIRLPERMPAGSYPARTSLYVNNALAGENRGTLRVLRSVTAQDAAR